MSSDSSTTSQPTTTSPLGGNLLSSPTLSTSRRNTGLMDDKPIRTGVVEKLVHEFQQLHNDNNKKEPNNGLHSTTTTSQHTRRPNHVKVDRYNKKRTTNSRKNKSLKRNGNINITNLAHNHYTTSQNTPITRNNKTSSKQNKALATVTASTISTSAPTTSTAPTPVPTAPVPISASTSAPISTSAEYLARSASDIDLQQQFFKSITNDLIRTMGAAVLKPSSVPNSSPLTDKSESTHSFKSASPSSSPDSSPRSSFLGRGKGATSSDDEKVLKRQMSKTLEPASVMRGASPTTFLSNSAPAHASSILSTLHKTPSSNSFHGGTASPTSGRRTKGVPALVLGDLASIRAGLNPVGLPIAGYSSAPPSPTATSSPTVIPSPLHISSDSPYTAPLSPRPLRPIHLLLASPPVSPRLRPSEKPTPTTESQQQQTSTTETNPIMSPDALRSASASPIPTPTEPERTLLGTSPTLARHASASRAHTSAFAILPASSSSLSSSTSTSTSSTTTPTSPSSLSSWTACKPLMNSIPNQNQTAQHRQGTRARHTLARPMSTIGFERYGSLLNLNLSIPGPGGDSESKSKSVPTSPLPSAPPSDLATAPRLNLHSSIDLPITSDFSTPEKPTSPSPFKPLSLPALGERSCSDSPVSISDSSPCESPREFTSPTTSPRPAMGIESPRGWNTEDIAATTGWRSPTLSSLSLPASPAMRVQRPASNTHHRLTRLNSSMTDLVISPRSSPENTSGFLAVGGVVQTASRSHSGSNAPVRSHSDPFISETHGKSDKEDPQPVVPQRAIAEDVKTSKNLLTRSVSAWQLTASKSSSEFIDLADESFSENRTDLIYTHTRAGVKIVKAGTLNALIEALTWQKQSDPAFVDAFLLTYPSFTTPNVLLDKLIERYNQPPPNGLTKEQQEEFENDILVVRLRVCSVLKSWADKHYYDFQKEPQLVEKFVTFMEGLKDRGMEKVAGIIVRALQKKLEGSGKRIIPTPTMREPSPILPKGEMTFLNFDDTELARQLTLIEYESYCCIRPRECLNQAWNKANREEESPNIVSMIRRSNSIPLWVATEIIKEDKLQRRVYALKKFINIAEQCRILNNFNAVMEIISGLNLTPVYRLRKTWDALPKKYTTIYDQLTALMAPKGNFKVYREELHTKDPPCVPFLGRYLTDLTFIEDAAKDVGEDMINFVKRMQLSVVIREIQQYQQTPYNLAIVPGIRDYLSKIFGFPEQELYSQSRMIEPPASSN